MITFMRMLVFSIMSGVVAPGFFVLAGGLPHGAFTVNLESPPAATPLRRCLGLASLPFTAPSPGARRMHLLPHATGLAAALRRQPLTARNSPFPTGTRLVVKPPSARTAAVKPAMSSGCEQALSTTSKPPGRSTRFRSGHHAR
jgi:hypothetical protein